jgi:hypothetical protein
MLSAALCVGLGVLVPAGPARASVPAPRPGYVVVGADGGVFAFGVDRFAGSLAGTLRRAPIVAVLPNADAERRRDGTVQPSGYLLVDAAGHVYPLGDTHSLGDLSRLQLRAPIVDAVGDSHGYLMVGADGGVFTFGRIRFRGSLAGQELSGPIVGAALAGAGGYWVASRSGRVWSFGAALAVGAPVEFPPLTPPLVLPPPVVGIAGDGNSDGFWLARSDGQVMPFGGAPDFGDLHLRHLAAPIVRIERGPGHYPFAQRAGSGYYLLGVDGGVFAFNAPFLGSMSGHRLARPATGMYIRLIPNSCIGLPLTLC